MYLRLSTSLGSVLAPQVNVELVMAKIMAPIGLVTIWVLTVKYSTDLV